MARRLGNVATPIASALVAGLMLTGCGAATPEARETVRDPVESAAPTAPATQASPEPSEVPASEPTASATIEQQPPVADAPALATLTGDANKQSDTFVLPGGKARLTYEFQDNSGQGMIMAAVYVLPEGTDLQVDGGFPEVTITEPGKGETILRKDAGEYFLSVMSANANYTVTIEVLE